MMFLVNILTLVQNFKKFDKGRGTRRGLIVEHCPESINPKRKQTIYSKFKIQNVCVESRLMTAYVSMMALTIYYSTILPLLTYC